MAFDDPIVFFFILFIAIGIPVMVIYLLYKFNGFMSSSWSNRHPSTLYLVGLFSSMLGVVVEFVSNVEFHSFITCPPSGCVSAIFTIASDLQYLGMILMVLGLWLIVDAHYKIGKVSQRTDHSLKL